MVLLSIQQSKLQMDLISQFAQKKRYFLEKGYHSVQIKAVASNYYEHDLSERKTILGAPCESHLCKCIIMENTNFNPEFESKYYQKYYCVIVQYVSKMNTMKLEKKLRELYNSQNDTKLTSRSWHLRLLKGDENYEITGYRYNAVEPFLMKTAIPIIMSEPISKLGFFWLGGGHTDLKIRVSVDEFQQKWQRADMFIVDLI